MKQGSRGPTRARREVKPEVGAEKATPRSAPEVVLPDVAALSAPVEFAGRAAEMGVEFDGEDLGRLGLYLALLLEVNKSTNLTAIEDAEVAWTRHILDSLTLLPLLAELGDGARVIDVGSGGGLPGIPLAICMAGVEFTLLEATGKKAAFLRLVVERLGLGNVRVLAERAEKAGQDRGKKIDERGTSRREGAHREGYDAVIARAVGRLATLAELTVPFAKVGQRVLLMKGAQAEAELEEAREALELLKCTATGTHETPTGRIVVLEKRSETPRSYPRADGEPKRSPLGVGRSRDSR